MCVLYTLVTRVEGLPAAASSGIEIPSVLSMFNPALIKICAGLARGDESPRYCFNVPTGQGVDWRPFGADFM